MLPRRRARQRRRRIIVGTLVALAAGYTLFGFFGLPPILKSQLEKRLGAALHRPVGIGRVATNPFALSVELEKLTIGEKKPPGEFVGWERLYVNFELASVFGKEWRFAAIELTGPRADVVVNADGSLNFSDLLTGGPAADPTAKAPEKSASKPLHIQRLVLSGARLRFRDQSRAQPFETTLGPVGFSVTDFRTLGGEQAPYSFEAVTELGEKFSWHGWMNAAPFRSGGELGLSNVVLKKYAPYYAEKLGVDLVDGTLTVKGRYEFNFGANQQVIKLLDGSVALRNVKIVERATGTPLFELPAADLTGATADGLALQASIQGMVLQGGRLNLRRETDGSLNLEKFAAPAAEAKVPPDAMEAVGPAATPSPARFSFRAGELALRDWTVEIQDRAMPQPVELKVTAINAALKDFTLEEGAKIPLEAGLHWQPEGNIQAKGTVVLHPLRVDLNAVVEAMTLMPLTPYFEQRIGARFTDGALSAQGRVVLETAAGQPPAVSYEGNAWLERVDLVTGSPGESFAGFSDLIVNGINATTAPQLSVRVEEVNLNSPYARIVRFKDGALNLTQALVPPAQPDVAGDEAKPAVAAKPAGDSAAPASAPQIEVARIVINGGDFTFNDRAMSPQVRLAVSGFGGTLSGWSSVNPAQGDVDLHAGIDGVGPVQVSGKFNPLGASPYVDAKLGVERVDLLPLSPYLGKYAGYELARGKLYVDVQAKIADGKIDSANVVTLDQFTWGRATSSPEATKLPVRLGVAMLKDLDGKIVIDLPVAGSFDDPEFRIGKVVWRVIGNLLVKVATSPFALVGSMFGGGGEELSYQEFSPGSSTLTPEATQKLATLVKALAARPGLNLGIEGNADAAADAYALRHQRLEAELRQAAWLERQPKPPKEEPKPASKKGTEQPSSRVKSTATPAAPIAAAPPPPSVPPMPADFTVPAEERAALVKKVFDRKFPPGTQFGTPLPPPPFIQPPPPHEPGGFVRRVIDFVTMRESREKQAFEAQQKKAQDDYLQEVRTIASAGLPLEEMEGRLAEAIAITPDDLRALAEARAGAVREYFINEGKIAPGRLFLTQAAEAAPAAPVAEGETPAETAAPATPPKGPRVFLELQ